MVIFLWTLSTDLKVRTTQKVVTGWSEFIAKSDFD